MIGRMAAVMGVLFAVCAGLAFGVHALGQEVAPSPTYLDTGFCDLPCWQGLRPGVDNINQFLWYAREHTPYSMHTSDLGDGVATMVELSTFGAITLADVLREFGPPERVDCLDLTHTTLYPGQSLVATARVYFAEGLIVVDAVRPDREMRLSPDMQVRTIRYYAPGEPLYAIGATTVWRGFAGENRYPACRTP